MHSRLPNSTPSDPKLLEVTINSPSCLAISYPYFGWLDDLRVHNESDEWIQDKIKELGAKSNNSGDNANQSKYKFENGFLKYKSRIVLSFSPWRSKIMYEHHNTPASGHMRVLKTYQRIKKVFYWSGLRKYIKKYVVGCQPCQQFKYET